MKKISTMLFAVMILLVSMVPVFAAESPQATTGVVSYEVIIIPTEGGDAKYEYVTGIDSDGKQYVDITALPKPGYEFDHWEILGAYTTKDKLTDTPIKLYISGDITVTPYYRKSSGDTPVATGTVNKDISGKSPQTGSSNAIPYIVLILSVAACGAATIKLVKSK